MCSPQVWEAGPMREGGGGGRMLQRAKESERNECKFLFTVRLVLKAPLEMLLSLSQKCSSMCWVFVLLLSPFSFRFLSWCLLPGNGVVFIFFFFVGVYLYINFLPIIFCVNKAVACTIHFVFWPTHISGLLALCPASGWASGNVGLGSGYDSASSNTGGDHKSHRTLKSCSMTKINCKTNFVHSYLHLFFKKFEIYQTTERFSFLAQTSIIWSVYAW